MKLRAYKEVLLILLISTLLLLLLVNNKLMNTEFISPLNEVIIQGKNFLSNWSLAGECLPKRNIVFIKTHKTGSSSVTNILHRYGDSHDLDFVLPAYGEYRLGWPNTFNASFYKRLLQDKKANLLSLHARYNRSSMEQVMDKNAFYLSILREPVSQYESTFSFMEFGKILQLGRSDHLATFMKDPSKILEDKIVALEFSNYYFQRLQLIRNGMLFDLGFPQNQFDNKDAYVDYIQKLDTEFDLVMIMEYFDESLVLLKRLLCWSLDDIVYFALNRRIHKRKFIRPSLRRKVEEWNAGDMLLYEHFNKTLWGRIAMEGADFHEEVKQFKDKLKSLQSTCMENPNERNTNSQKKRLVREVNVEQFILRRDLNDELFQKCQSMLRNETYYIDCLKKKQGVPLNETEMSKDRTKGLEYLHTFVDSIYKGTAMVIT